MAPTPQYERRLLILPPAPSRSDYAAIKAAYERPLREVFAVLQPPLILQIALPCPHLYQQRHVPRCTLYQATQDLVAQVYKLICVISTRQSIDITGPDGIDARILLVEYPRDGEIQNLHGEAASASVHGPVIDLKTLAAVRPPRRLEIYSVNNEAGKQLWKNFRAVGELAQATNWVPGGVDEGLTETQDQNEEAASAARRHFDVAVGGTFDHLHVGHKLLLTMTAFMVDEAPEGEQVNRSLTVGITGDELLRNKKYAEYLESWTRRKDAVDGFLRSIICVGRHDQAVIRVEEKSEPGPNGHRVLIQMSPTLTVKCVEIEDPFGPTITEEAISALVVSAETRSGGDAVNSKRKEKGWAELDVFEVDVLDPLEGEEKDSGGQKSALDEGFKQKISSTEIRRLESVKATQGAG